MNKIYVKGYVGNLGTKILIEKKSDELAKHFSKEYLHLLNKNIDDTLKGGEIPSLSMLENIIIDREKITKGGVLTALWKICERNKWGLTYNLRSIPILQGTIEISNFFDLNPYRLLTDNAEIIAVDDDKIVKDNTSYESYSNLSAIIEHMPDAFAEIGETTSAKKRVRIDGEVEAFLTKDYKDEIDKIIPKWTKMLS